MADSSSLRPQAEPQPTDERLGNVRPDPRPSPDHAGHDRWLVVRWTTDPTDLSAAEAAQARALLADCTECAALAADLGVISHATASSVTPVRPRDFRLTPAQAASARGGIVDRVRRWLAAPGTFAARPLAGAALAIGLLLVIVAPNIPSVVTTPGDGAGRETVAGAPAAGATDTAHGKATVDPAGMAPRVPEAGTQATAGPEGDSQDLQAPVGTMASGAGGAEMYADGPGSTAAADESQPSDLTLMRVGGFEEPTGDPDAADASPTDGPDTAMAQGGGSPAPDGGPTSGERGTGGADGATTSTATMDDTTYALTLLGIVLAGVGVMVLVLSWLARRWQDPLLR